MNEKFVRNMKLIQCDESRLTEVTAFYHRVIEYLQTHIKMTAI